MERQRSTYLLLILIVGLASGFWACGRSVSPVPRTEVYGGVEPEYVLSEDEAELFEILDAAYRRHSGKSLEIDGWLQGAARRMNWLLRQRGYGFSSKKLWRQIINNDSIADGVSSPDAVPLASEAQRSIWIAGSTLAYPFVFTGLSAGLFDEFDADRLHWDDILGFDCNVVGVGVHRRLFPPGRWVTFLFAERGVLLDEFPKIVEPNETYHMSGEMLPGYINPELLVTTPWGEVDQYELEQDFTGEFHGDVSFDSGPGDYLLELTLESPSGPRVGGLFPISAGGRYPESYSIWENTGYQVFDDPDRATEVGVSLINRDRARFRLPEIRHNPVLSRIARQYSQEMRNRKFLAHVTPEGKDLEERLAETGILFQRALENVSVGYSIPGIQAGLMNSPGHRRNILDPNVNQVGVGVAWTEGEDPPRAFETQLFVKTFEKIDPVADREKILSEINRRRIAQGIPPLVTNYIADWLAKEHSKALATGNISGSDTLSDRDILVQFQRTGVHFTRAAALVKQVGSLDQILDSDVLYDSTYYWVGIGLNQSENRDAMESWVWTTVLLFRDE